MHFIDQQRTHYAVQQLCQVLDVMPSRYDAWRHRQAAGAMGASEPAWEAEMLAVFGHYERRYGTRRLQVEYGKKATGWAVRPCARGCAATTGGPCSPRPSPRARPIQPTNSAAPQMSRPATAIHH